MKTVPFILCVAALTAGYVGFRYYEIQSSHITNTAPTLSVPNNTLEVSCKEGNAALLKDVTANDEEDGNLSDQVQILDISKFDENNERTITYIVYDRSDESVTATRKVKYTDYQRPTFTLIQSMINEFVPSNDELKNYISVISPLDGDISNQVAVDFQWTGDTTANVTYTVSDSTGNTTTSTYPFTYMYSLSTASYTIELQRYSVPVEQGNPIDPMEYIIGVSYNGTALNYLASTVTIETNYDPNTPGTYECFYHINRNGEFGVTKLVITVVPSATVEEGE